MAKLKTCSIPDCERPRRKREWCAMHYERWRQHGDPIKTLIAPMGEPLRYFHEVVLNYEGDECLTWPFYKDGDGYGRLRNKIVSRLVCEEVNGPPPTSGHEAAHSCGKGHEACVTKGHLSWKTRKDNAADMVAHGASMRGERNSQSKLMEADARQILALKGEMLQVDIAARYGISYRTVSAIHLGKNWAWISDPDPVKPFST